MVVCLLGAASFLTLASPAVAQSASARAAPASDSTQAALRDSLMREVQRYTEMIAQLRDSLVREGPTWERGDARGRIALEEALEEFSGVISSLSKELSELDLDIDDQTISLRDKDGGGIEINIPEDLGEQISQGISSITQVILSELPDTLALSRAGESWHRVLNVGRTPAPRRVIGGDAVKIWNDIDIGADQDVRGNVVTLFGDATVEGRVDGDVVVIFGDLDLTEGAEVMGKVVTIFGRLDRDEGAVVHDTEFVLDPYLMSEFGGASELFAGGGLAFLARQFAFILVAFFVSLLVAIFPADRLTNVQLALTRQPASCLGYGVLVTVLGHIGLTILFGVLVLTVIGIPLALLLLLGIFFFGLLAIAVVSLEVGRWICRMFNMSVGQDWLVSMLGLLVLHAVSFLGGLIGLWQQAAPLALLLGILGVAVKLVVYCFGVGALIISRFGTRSPTAEVAEPVAQV